GDDRKAEDLDSHVPGDDDLVHGGHTDKVGSENAEGADLGWSLIAGAEDGEVDAFGERDILPGSFGLGEGAQGRRIGCGHVEEAWAELGLIRSEGGVHSGEIDMVGNGDERALFVAGVDAAVSIG